MTTGLLDGRISVLNTYTQVSQRYAIDYDEQHNSATSNLKEFITYSSNCDGTETFINMM